MIFKTALLTWRFPKRIVFLLLFLIPAQSATTVVINEVMYHPTDDGDALQYVELWNSSSTDVDLSGWKFTHGPKYDFPARTKIPAHGYLVICRNSEAFRRAYIGDISLQGNFTGKLNHKGEKIELVDATGKVIETFKYSDHEPWPLGADGYNSSLERISDMAPADDPSNWAPSKPARGKESWGTPGRENTVFSAKALPAVNSVAYKTIAPPGQPISVTARITSATPVKTVTLEYTRYQAGKPSVGNKVDLHPSSADHLAYFGNIPPVQNGTLVRFTLKVTTEEGLHRIDPSPNDPRPAYGVFVTDATNKGKIPAALILNTGAMIKGGQKFGPSAAISSDRGQSAFIYIPPSGEPLLRDFVQVRRRSGGWKVHFLKDQPLDEMRAINIIFEGPSRWVLSEHLAYELYRRSGVLTEKSGHYQLTMDGRPLGYYLFVEQPDKTFLQRNKRDENGNLYKILWYEQGVVRQHEKKSNKTTGHKDIIGVIDTLNKTSGEKQWAYIQEQFNVDEMANYFAVNMCIQNWDGFFNNYFTYHDTSKDGKWEIIPWDEDKTWGDYDGVSPSYDWYDMPLTTGMKGDRAPRAMFNFGGGPWGGPQWWRPGGWFSAPLLANPQFRKKFETRLREICNTVFTEEKFGPVIEELRQKLRPEVSQKAKFNAEDPQAALSIFDHEIDSFKRQLTNRRRFILKQLPAS
jgi:hypothetical protein